MEQLRLSVGQAGITLITDVMLGGGGGGSAYYLESRDGNL